MPHFNSIIQIPSANYRTDMPWSHLEGWLNSHGKLTVEMCPDFQRGHVWTDEQSIKYIEYILRGGISGRDIFWNCKGWMRNFEGPLQLVDGLQRITAVLKFLRNEIPAFGHLYTEWEGTLSYDCGFRFHVHNMQNQEDVLKWYLDLNEGGVVHTTEELERVRELYDTARTSKK